MYNNDYMYAIERSDEYLAHYGILGMKWGIRRAMKTDEGKRAVAVSRQYAKAQKHLAKLEKRAAKSGTYAKRAAALGAAAGIAGGAALLGTEGVGRLYRGAGKGVADAAKVGGQFMNRAGHGISALGEMTRSNRNKNIRKIGMALDSAGRGVSRAGNAVTGAARPINSTVVKGSNALSRWGKGHSLSRGAASALNNFGTSIQAKSFRNGTSALGRKAAAKVGMTSWKVGSKINAANLSNNAIARIGAGAIGAGLAAGAARNAYKAATAKRKAEKFRSEMNKAFTGTQYANGGNRQGKKRRRS